MYFDPYFYSTFRYEVPYYPVYHTIPKLYQHSIPESPLGGNYERGNNLEDRKMQNNFKIEPMKNVNEKMEGNENQKYVYNQQVKNQSNKKQSFENLKLQNSYIPQIINNKKKKQKKGRNIKSNIFWSMIKFMLSKQCSLTYLKKIISYHSLHLTPKRYQMHLRACTKKLNTYIKNQQLQDFWIGSGSSQNYRKVTRILVHIYLESIHFLHTSNSKKISEENRMLHKSFCKQMLNDFLST